MQQFAPNAEVLPNTSALGSVKKTSTYMVIQFWIQGIIKQDKMIKK